MIKKVTISFILFLFFIAFPYFAFADGQPPASNSKNGNFTKKTFSNDNSWSKNGKASAPPDPTLGSGGGNPLPISGGLAFLLFGSTAYFIKRVRDEKKEFDS